MRKSLKRVVLSSVSLSFKQKVGNQEVWVPFSALPLSQCSGQCSSEDAMGLSTQPLFLRSDQHLSFRSTANMWDRSIPQMCGLNLYKLYAFQSRKLQILYFHVEQH